MKRKWMSVLGMNIPLRKCTDTLQRRPGFKVSGLKKKGFSPLECEHFMEMEKCLHNNRDHFWHVL
jgi:hypothetical protein